MSGLLQRLVEQARTQVAGASPIRPAMGVHAQVPVGTAAVEMPATSILEVPRPQTKRDHLPPVYKSKQEVSQKGIRESPSATTHGALAEPPRSSRTPARMLPVVQPVEREPSTLQSGARIADRPQPLLPENPSPRVAQFTHAPLTNAQQQPASGIRPDGHREAAEVHVHIGSIEVTAVQEPRPVRKAPTGTTPHKSLADYLARKSS